MLTQTISTKQLRLEDRHKTFDDAFDAYHANGAGIVEVDDILSRGFHDKDTREVVLWVIIGWRGNRHER